MVNMLHRLTVFILCFFLQYIRLDVDGDDGDGYCNVFGLCSVVSWCNNIRWQLAVGIWECIFNDRFADCLFFISENRIPSHIQNHLNEIQGKQFVLVHTDQNALNVEEQSMHTMSGILVFHLGLKRM